MKIYCIIDWKSPQKVHFRIDRHFNAICQLCGVFSIIVNSFLNFWGLLSLIIKTFYLFPFVYHWKRIGYLVLLVKKETHRTQQNFELCSLTVQWGNHVLNNDINSPRNNETIFLCFFIMVLVSKYFTSTLTIDYQNRLYILSGFCLGLPRWARRPLSR